MGEIERFMGPISSRLQPESDGLWVRYSDHLADKAAELERLAGKLEADAKQIEADNPEAPERSVGRVIARRQDASRLRERAAELRKAVGR